jgi:DNA-binding transcriptional LysR family regulator
VEQHLKSIYNIFMKSFSRGLKIDVRRLQVLRELRLHSTIGATAQALNLTPSAVSQQIAALSRDIGAPLLAPNGRGVRLTPQAQLLLEHATLIDMQLERARADLAAMEQGTIGRFAVGAFATAVSGLVAPAIEHLRDQCPGISIRVEEAEAPECFVRLDRGDLDMAIAVDYRSGPLREDARYHREELLDDPFWVAVPEGHPQAGRVSIDLRTLAKERWVMGAMNGPCLQAALGACAAAGFTPEVAHRVNDWSAFVPLVASGSVGLIPHLAINATLLRGVTVRPVARRWRSSRHLYLAIRAGAERSPAMAAVLSALQASRPETFGGNCGSERPRCRRQPSWHAALRGQGESEGQH